MITMCKNCNMVVSIYNDICSACGEVILKDKVEEPTELTNLIAFCAPTQQSGKTTCANFFVDQLGFQKKAFASTFKRMLLVLLRDLGLSDKEITYYTEIAKEETIPQVGKSYRYLMRSIGNEWGRDLVHENLWVMSTVNSLQGKVVFDDVRRNNEADALKHRGCVLIRVINPRTKVDRSHASEGELDTYPVDYEIINDGTIEELYTKLYEIYYKIIHRKVGSV